MLVAPGLAVAACNDGPGTGVEGRIFDQFSSYFRSARNRETQTRTEGYPSAWKDRRFSGSGVFIRTCTHLSDNGETGAGEAVLLVEKPAEGPGVFLHSAVFRLWNTRPGQIESWLEGAKAILSASAIDTCVFDSAATDAKRSELRALYGNGLKRWEALCWNGLYSGYAAILRQDRIDGSYDGEIESRYGDNQLLVWIDIKALVD